MQTHKRFRNDHTGHSTPINKQELLEQYQLKIDAPLHSFVVLTELNQLIIQVS